MAEHRTLCLAVRDRLRLASVKHVCEFNLSGGHSCKGMCELHAAAKQQDEQSIESIVDEITMETERTANRLQHLRRRWRV